MRTLFHPLPRKQFEKLAEHKEPFCTSIYIPMFKSGKELNQGLSEAYLKSSIKESVLSLKNQGMADKEAELYVEPLKKLLSETDLWRNPVDGLAIFLSTQYGLQYYRLPIRFEVQYYVSDHFLLLPLLAMYEPETSFYLLALSQDHVKLYEGNTFELRNIPISELAPQKLEDTVGSDYEQKMLQVRSGHMQYEEGSFHGHGEGKDDESKEVKYFFREINKGVSKVLKKKAAPLILACVEWLYPVYKKVNTYSNLHAEYIGGDPEFKNIDTLHKQTLKLVGKSQGDLRNQYANRFTELHHTAKASHQVSEIVPAAIHGKVDTLFLKKGADVFGTYNKSKNCVIIDTEKTPKNLSLTNLAANHSLINGGKVFMVEKSDMPFASRPLNAIFRY